MNSNIVNNTLAVSLLSDTASRYEALAAAVSKRHSSLELSLQCQEQFNEAYRRCMELLYLEQQRLKKISNSNVDDQETDQLQIDHMNVCLTYLQIDDLNVGHTYLI